MPGISAAGIARYGDWACAALPASIARKLSTLPISTRTFCLEAATNRRFFDIVARYYDLVTAQGTDWRASCRDLADDISSDMRVVVDLGTGSGVSAYEVAKVVPRVTVIGIDISGSMLGRARRAAKRYRAVSQRVEFLQADSERLPLRSGSVDAITTHSFLYLVSRRASVMKEIARVLCTGGKAIFFEPKRERQVMPPRGTWVSRPAFALSIFLWGLTGRLEGAFRGEELPSLVRAAGLELRESTPSLEGYAWRVVAEQPGREGTAA
jgi:ubiquinone/menaquinone biosynthesis C-methylase UbiE